MTAAAPSTSRWALLGAPATVFVRLCTLWVELNGNGASNNVMMETSLNQYGAQKQAVSELERTIDEHLDGT